jgi:hypothetical protein
MALLLVSARAAAAGARIGVPEFEGAQEAVVRQQVMQVLKSHGLEAVGARDMQETILLNGLGLESEGDLKTLSKELRLSAIVTGEVGPRRARIVVHGGDGSVVGEASFAGANPRKVADEVGATFWQKLGDKLPKGRSPAAAKPPARKAKEEAASTEDAEATESAPPTTNAKKKPRFKMEQPAPEEAAEPSAEPSGPATIPWLDLEVGVGGLNRSLSFNQNVVVYGSAILSPYSLTFGPVAVARVVAYPWVEGSVGNLGVEAEIQQGLAISSTLPNGATYTSAVHEYGFGFRYRVRFATDDDVFLSLGFGEDAFTFNGAARSSLLTPDTIYHYLRVGAGMHLTITDGIAISFGGGYRDVLNRAGHQISTDFFPRLTVAGADAEIVGSYALTGTFSLRAGLEWRRYWYDMHSQIGDAAVAGGAVDQSFTFTAGLAVRLGASGVPPAQGDGGAEKAGAAPSDKPEDKPGKTPKASSDDGDADQDAD